LFLLDEAGVLVLLVEIYARLPAFSLLQFQEGKSLLRGIFRRFYHGIRGTEWFCLHWMSFSPITMPQTPLTSPFSQFASGFFSLTLIFSQWDYQ